MSTTLGPTQGFLLRARIYSYNPGSPQAKIYIESQTASPTHGPDARVDPTSLYDAFVPISWTGVNGEFIGGFPTKGNRVLVGQEQGGKWFILQYLPSENTFQNTNTLSKSSTLYNKLVNLKEGRALFQTEPNNYIYIDRVDRVGTRIGGLDKFLQINPYLNIFSHNMDQEYLFTEATRSIKGIVKRDLSPNISRGIDSSMLSSQEYDKTLTPIRMDTFSPISPGTQGSSARNLPICENREITYEFANSFGFTNDQDESEKYDSKKTNTGTKFIVNRHESRADALSLGLNESNQLIEIIKGTCVDVYGNILDLNRTPLLIGKKQEISLRESDNKKKAFLKIREQLRKSIAYHFEINTRKAVNLPDIDSNKDYARDRSRFSFDVDKEGQFKINVPASSETGNIPFLTRHENFSVISNKQDHTFGATEFLRNPDHQDIYADTFASNTPILVKRGDKDFDGYDAPIDRLTSSPMMYGTAYHDISGVLDYRNLVIPLEQYDKDDKLSAISNNTAYAGLYKRPVVADKITISGDKANAGGRSGSLNFDGSLVFNIGANTADRQSLWLDTAGGMLATLGRDFNNISLGMKADGDINLFIGGPTINNDSRFTKKTVDGSDIYNGNRVGNLDIRVWSPTGLTVVKISGDGVSIATPGRLDIVAKQTISIKSINGDLQLYGHSIWMYADAEQNGRLVRRNGQEI